MVEKKRNPNSLANLTQNRPDKQAILERAAKTNAARSLARTNPEGNPDNSPDINTGALMSGDPADSIKQLKAVLKVVEKKKGKSFLESFVSRGYDQKEVAISLMNKIFPDLKKQMFEINKRVIVLQVAKEDLAKAPAHMKKFISASYKPEEESEEEKFIEGEIASCEQ